MAVSDTLKTLIDLLKSNGYVVVIRPQEAIRPNELLINVESVSVDEHFTGGVKLNVVYSVTFIEVDRITALDHIENIIKIVSIPMFVFEDVDIDNDGEYVICTLLFRSVEVIMFG